MPKRLPTLIIACFVMALNLSISACGWHLRGLTPLPQSIQGLHIISSAPISFNTSLKRNLELNGVEIISKFNDEISVLQIKEFNIERRENTVNASGRVDEYQLYGYLKAEIINQKKQQSKEFNISEQRFFNNDVSNQAGTAANEVLQRADMQQQLINKLIVQLGKTDLAIPKRTTP